MIQEGSVYYLMSKMSDFYYATNGDFGAILSLDRSILGEYNVKIAKSNKEYVPHLLTVASNAQINIMSSELTDGDATFKIIGSDNDINYEETKKISKGDNTFVDTFIGYPNMLDYLNSGKTFKVEITQNGKTYILGGTPFNYINTDPNYYGCSYSEYYYWGNNDIEQAPYGC